MNKKKSIFLIMVVLFFIFNMIMIKSSFAVDNFVNAAKQTSASSKEVTDMVNAVLNLVQLVSVGIATIMLTVLAIKYMYSSVDERAEIKKHAIVYVIGCILIFGATGIVKIIRDFSKNVKSK